MEWKNQKSTAHESSFLMRPLLFRTGETEAVSFLAFHWWRLLLRGAYVIIMMSSVVLAYVPIWMMMIDVPIPIMKLTKPYRQSFTGRPPVRYDGFHLFWTWL